jgi:hypothetical protein
MRRRRSRQQADNEQKIQTPLATKSKLDFEMWLENAYPCQTMKHDQHNFTLDSSSLLCIVLSSIPDLRMAHKKFARHSP